jgi:hypothetical protein
MARADDCAGGGLVRVVFQVHIAGLIITPINYGKQSEVAYVNVIKHAVDLPVVCRRLFSDHMVIHSRFASNYRARLRAYGCCAAA